MNRLQRKLFQPTTDQLKLHFRRFEFKYALSSKQLAFIKPTIARRLPLDSFAKTKGFYHVNSLYFDTPALSSYLQTEAGVKDRVKYRLRTYPDSPTGSRLVFWEIKRKHDMTVVKDRSPLTQLQSNKLLQNQSFSAGSDQTLNKFLFAKNRYFLKPKILIRYRRIPFIGSTPELRITFDSDFEVAGNSGNDYQSILPNLTIMEIKFTGSLPFWLAQIVRVHNLSREPFSKYCLCLQKAKSYLPWIMS